jgi:hypothetical protein
MHLKIKQYFLFENFAVINRNCYGFYSFEKDTVTGFLLAGIGNVDHNRQKNYLVVDSS